MPERLGRAGERDGSTDDQHAALGAEATDRAAIAVERASRAIDGVEHALDRFSSHYDEQAAGKTLLQQGMDGLRGAIWGDRDAQRANIRATDGALADLRAGLQSGATSPSQVHVELARIDAAMRAEAGRVERAQIGNARVGETLQVVGRGAVVGVAGLAATAASGGNPWVGAAAATVAGSAYDAVSVATAGTGPIAPQLDSGKSLGGTAANALVGRPVHAGDWVGAAGGSAMDAVTGGLAGAAARSSHAAYQSFRQAAAPVDHETLRACLGTVAARASARIALVENAARGAIEATTTAADPTLTGAEKRTRIAQDLTGRAMHLPTDMMFAAASGALGAGPGIGPHGNGAIAEAAADGALGLGQAAVDGAIDGRGVRLHEADWAEAVIQVAPHAVRGPRPSATLAHASEIDESTSRAGERLRGYGVEPSDDELYRIAEKYDAQASWSGAGGDPPAPEMLAIEAALRFSDYGLRTGHTRNNRIEAPPTRRADGWDVPPHRQSAAVRQSLIDLYPDATPQVIEAAVRDGRLRSRMLTITALMDESGLSPSQQAWLMARAAETQGGMYDSSSNIAEIQRQLPGDGSSTSSHFLARHLEATARLRHAADERELLDWLGGVDATTSAVPTAIVELLTEQPFTPDSVSRAMRSKLKAGQTAPVVRNFLETYLETFRGDSMTSVGRFNPNEIDRGYLDLSRQVARSLDLRKGEAPHERPLRIGVVESPRNAPTGSQQDHPGLPRNLTVPDPKSYAGLSDHGMQVAFVAGAGLPNAEVRLLRPAESDVLGAMTVFNTPELVAKEWLEGTEDLAVVNVSSQLTGTLFSPRSQERLAELRHRMISGSDAPWALSAGNDGKTMAGDEWYALPPKPGSNGSLLDDDATPAELLHNQGMYAQYPNVGVVAALNSLGTTAAYSTRGSGIDFTAPGTLHVPSNAFETGAPYEKISGTSFSSPYTARIVATVRSLDPDLSAEEAWTIVFDTRKAPRLSRDRNRFEAGGGGIRTNGTEVFDPDARVRASAPVDARSAQTVAALTRLLRAGLTDDDALTALRLDHFQPGAEDLLKTARRIVPPSER